MDRRVRKTRESIIKIFLHILENKPLSKITVAEISKQADINRGTFYLHYRDVYDLLQRIVQSTIQDILLIVDQSYHDTKISYPILTNSLIHYFQNNHPLLFLLFNSEQGDQTIHQLEQKVVDEVLRLEESTDKKQQITFETIFIVAGILSVLTNWMTHYQSSGKEEIEEILSSLLDRFTDD